jgi:hypothetical protein
MYKCIRVALSILFSAAWVSHKKLKIAPKDSPANVGVGEPETTSIGVQCDLDQSDQVQVLQIVVQRNKRCFLNSTFFSINPDPVIISRRLHQQ